MPSSYYTRTCAECGDVATVTYKPKPTSLCKECNKPKGHNKAWSTRAKVQYWYFCPNCNNIRVLGSKRKSQYCASCSRTMSKRKIKITFDLESMQYILPPRYFKLCKKCGRTVQVLRKYESGFVNSCDDCKGLPKVKKPNKVKSRGIDKKVVEREREKNRLYKAMLEEQEVDIEDIPQQKISDEEMKAAWLKNNKPTIIS